METKTFWKRIKNLSSERKVTQEVVAEAVGMPFDSFMVCRSKGSFPPLDNTIKLCRYFDVSVQYLICGEDADFSTKIKEAQVS